MKKLALFMPQKDFKDETVAIIKLIMTKWGVQCDLASYGRTCIGMHGALYKADINASEIDPANYDGIIFADGRGIDDQKIFDYRPLLDKISRFNDAKKPIICIGNAVKIPARANIVNGRKLSVCDAETKRFAILFYGVPSTNNLEVSSNLMTISSSKSVEESAELILQHIGVS